MESLMSKKCLKWQVAKRLSPNQGDQSMRTSIYSKNLSLLLTLTWAWVWSKNIKTSKAGSRLVTAKAVSKLSAANPSKAVVRSPCYKFVIRTTKWHLIAVRLMCLSSKSRTHARQRHSLTSRMRMRNLTETCWNNPSSLAKSLTSAP